MKKEYFITKSEDETIELGASFANRLVEGDMTALYGDLGSGKTGFIKGVCNFFKVEEIVTSPTFTIINQYAGARDLVIYHIDLYRINSKKELDEIGLRECVFSDTGIKLVEWADKANGLLPDRGYNVRIELNDKNENERIFHIERRRP